MSPNSQGWLAENPPVAPMDEADVYTAVHDFILAFVTPKLAPENIFQGRQNQIAIPHEAGGLAVLNVLLSTQHGSTLEDFSAPGKPGILTVKALMLVDMQVDFYGHGDTPRQQAQRFAVTARSSIGTQFFSERGLSALYAEDVSERPFDDGTDQYLRRYGTTLRLSVWCGNNIEAPYFNTVQLARLKNAAAHNPITSQE